jgi:hypothetical protein
MVTSHHHHALKILSHVTYTLNCIKCTNPRPLQPGPPCQLAWPHLTHQCQALRDQKKSTNNPRACHAGHHSHHLVTPAPDPLQPTSPCPVDRPDVAKHARHDLGSRRRIQSLGPLVVTASRLASACTSTATGAPVRLLDPSPHTFPRSLLSPTCSP